MVNVDVDVEDAVVILEQLEDCKDNVVDVAEAGCLAPLGVVQPAGPVDGDVGVSMVQLDGAPYRSSGRYLAVLEEAVKDRTVLANIDYAGEIDW